MIPTKYYFQGYLEYKSSIVPNEKEIEADDDTISYDDKDPFMFYMQYMSLFIILHLL